MMPTREAGAREFTGNSSTFTPVESNFLADAF